MEKVKKINIAITLHAPLLKVWVKYFTVQLCKVKQILD
jgi:hypothetical protein